MKFENKFVVAHNEEGVIVAKSEGNVEIFAPSNITIQSFDTEEERSTYIIEQELTSELYD